MVDPAWGQQQKLLAHGTRAGDAASAEQHMAQGTGAAKHQGFMVQGTGLFILVERANSLNRPLRTRMVGGVGAGGEKPTATRLGSTVPPHGLHSY